MIMLLIVSFIEGLKIPNEFGLIRALSVRDNSFIFTTSKGRVIVMSMDGSVTEVVAGSGRVGYGGDGGRAIDAELSDWIGSVGFTSNGMMILADTNNDRVRSVEDGMIQTIVEMKSPQCVHVAPSGEVYLVGAEKYMLRWSSGRFTRIEIYSSVAISIDGKILVGNKDQLALVDVHRGTTRRLAKLNQGSSLTISHRNEVYVSERNFISTVSQQGMMKRLKDASQSINSLSIGPDNSLYYIQGWNSIEKLTPTPHSRKTREEDYNTYCGATSAATACSGRGNALQTFACVNQDTMGPIVKNSIALDTNDHIILLVHTKAYVKDPIIVSAKKDTMDPIVPI